MSIERFECDMESILHDTLMDGDTLDFNFDSMGAPQGFSHSVKTTTHSWVSGVDVRKSQAHTHVQVNN
uniref:FOXO protein transactivation domain-containing protein n=1 Tax=Anguilla anguilla TaxID=7936 RepID=A0A0E9PL23_ANGAN